MNDRPLILVVDDDVPILMLMSKVLQEFGFEPVTASSGASAIDEARRHKPALLLLDRKMPGMNGDEVIRAIHEESELAQTPVIVLSGEPMTEPEIRKIGAVAAILKPFELQALVELVRKHARP